MLKGPTYKLVEENSRYADSFFYSLEAGALGKKSLYHAMFMGTQHKPFYSDVSKCNNSLQPLLQ